MLPWQSTIAVAISAGFASVAVLTGIGLEVVQSNSLRAGGAQANGMLPQSIAEVWAQPHSAASGALQPSLASKDHSSSAAADECQFRGTCCWKLCTCQVPEPHGATSDPRPATSNQ